MKLLNAALIGVGAFVAVKYFRDGKMTAQPYPLPGETGPGATVPMPGAGAVVPGAPGGDTGVVGTDPGVVPVVTAPSTGQPCAGCSGGSAPGNFRSLILTAPPPRTPPRDHREVPTGGKFQKPRSPTTSIPPVACIRAPCPTKPTSGMTSPHHQSRTIQIALAHAPVVY